MLYIFFLVGFLITNICEEFSNTELEEIISLIKQRLAIYSLQCEFTVRSELFPINRSTIRTGEFAMYGDNLFILAADTFTRYIHGSENKNKKSSNLIELLTAYKGDKERTINIEGYSAFYRYNGVSSNRIFTPEVSFQGDEIKILENVEVSKYTRSDLPTNSDPRMLIGYIGRNIAGISEENNPKRKLIEALDKKGKFYLYKVENHTILWHDCTYDASLHPLGEEEHLSFEVWIDKDNNITKIIVGDFPARSYGIETVKEVAEKYNLPVEINCNQPNQILYVCEFSDFKEFENNIRVPTRGKLIKYDYERDEKCSKSSDEIITKFNKNEIPLEEVVIWSTICINKQEIKAEYEVWIHPETLQVNQHISDEIFIPPEITVDIPVYNENGKEAKTIYSRHKLIFLISFFVITTFLLVYIAKRFLGLGF